MRQNTQNTQNTLDYDFHQNIPLLKDEEIGVKKLRYKDTKTLNILGEGQWCDWLRPWL